jgi:hypothetical protein
MKKQDKILSLVQSATPPFVPAQLLWQQGMSSMIFPRITERTEPITAASKEVQFPKHCVVRVVNDLVNEVCVDGNEKGSLP